VIDDGSKDDTYEIAKACEKEYPGIVRAIHQENKGHGGAVNTGLSEAQGLYYKVCDSDDWLAYDALMECLQVIRDTLKGPETLDAIVMNYMYDKVGVKKKRVMRYVGNFPENRIFTWKEIEKPLGPQRYVLMHSLVYRTNLLKESGLKLPEHTFYVDNLVAFQPMIYVRTLYYINMTLYRYFIGRDDQSVNEKVMLTRLDQQLRVTRMMIDEYRPDLVKEKNHMEFLVHYMSIMMTVSSVLLMRKGDEESLKAKKELWEYLKKKDLKLYMKLRYNLLGRLMNMPGRAGRLIAVKGYQIVQKFYGFN